MLTYRNEYAITSVAYTGVARVNDEGKHFIDNRDQKIVLMLLCLCRIFELVKNIFHAA